MREEEDDRAIFSKPLQAEIRSCLDSGRQAILLLNRRGYNTFVSCRACGHVMTCPSCSISMTYHRANGLLVCHYCGHMQEPVTACPECGSDRVGIPGWVPSGRNRNSWSSFRMRRCCGWIPIPLCPVLPMKRSFRSFPRKIPDPDWHPDGSQGVGLPAGRAGGVLSADQSLYGDDFRCFESTFSLLTQVIGRAGRRELPGGPSSRRIRRKIT